MGLLTQVKAGDREYKIFIGHDESIGDFMEDYDFDADWKRGVRNGEIGILSLHRRYNVGHNHHMQEPEDLQETIEDFKQGYPSAKVLPLYCYEHSMIALSVKSFHGRAHHAEWDSGQIGWVVYDERTMEEADVEALLKEYSDYLNGNVFYVWLEEGDGGKWVHVDGFGGIMPDGIKDAAMELAHCIEEPEARKNLIKQLEEVE